MKNKERFAKEIIEIAKDGFTVGLNKETGLPMACNGWCSCVDCVFHIGNKDCQEERKKWFEEDPFDVTMARIELRSLESIKNNYKYIAKDPDGRLKVSEAPLYRNSDNFCWVNAHPDFKSSCIGELKGNFDMLNNSDKECKLIEDVKKELIKKINEEER